MAIKKDSENFFKTSTHEEDYWEKYLAARPKYSQDFYERVVNYHKSHQMDSSSEPKVAHDVGTGPGQVAGVLSKYFDQVVASDLNDQHLSVAARRLGIDQANPSKSKIKLEHMGAESLHTKYPPGSASLVVAAECMALIDAEKAFNSWSAVLRPGGTLAIWFYGRPHFVEGEGYDAKACDEIYSRVADLAFSKWVKKGSEAHRAGWKRATDCMVSFLDNVAIPSDQFTDIQRWKWNPDWYLSFYGPDACDFEIEVESKIGPEEKVVDMGDRNFWGEEWSVADWKLFLKMNLPSFREDDWNEDIEVLWKEMEDKMGGEGVKRRIGWPVVAILATKK